MQKGMNNSGQNLLARKWLPAHDGCFCWMLLLLLAACTVIVVSGGVC